MDLTSRCIDRYATSEPIDCAIVQSTIIPPELPQSAGMLRAERQPINGKKMTDNTSVSGKMCAFELETDSVEVAYGQIIKRLALRYFFLYPDKSAADFSNEILIPLASSTPEAPATIALTFSADHSKHTYAFAAKLLLEACAFCVAALDADLDGRQGDAWRYVSNAMYKLGVLEGTVILDPFIGSVLQERSASGAKKRTEKYAPLRELACKLASTKTHMSKRGAVFSIMEEVLAEADRIGVTLSKTQTERTITSWLEGMSFGSKREP